MGPETKTADDVELLDISALEWEDIPVAAESIKNLDQQLLKKSLVLIHWYMLKRKRRKLGAQSLRVLAVLSASAGGLVPVLSLLDQRIPIELGYVLIALAGACLLFNRALGISSAWIRFITTAFSLVRLTEELQFEWAEKMTAMSGKPSSRKEIKALLERLKDFNRSVNALVEGETKAWGVEFDDDLAQLEKTVEARSNALRSRHASP